MIESSMSSGKMIVFGEEPQSGVTYRIPALLYIPTDRFLAFAEKRRSTRDEDAEHLVLRRGQKKGDSVEWGPMEYLMSAVLPGHRTMNPCPVYERKSETIFLFFICVRKDVTEGQQIKDRQNAARLCYVQSRDAGQTWSSLTDLTELVIGEDLKDWATFAVGPGHGVQLSSGQLVIPAYVYHITSCCCGCRPWSCCCRPWSCCCWTSPHSLMFCSDDAGQHWHKGELIQEMETIECEVAEVLCQNGDNMLYCSARTLHNYRAAALSADGGLTFERSSPCKQLCEPPPQGCQGSVVSFTPTSGRLEVDAKDGPDSPACEKGGNAPSLTDRRALSWLLYSHPMSKDKREDLGIYLNTSPLEEAKWEAHWVLYTGPCGYSDLAVCQGPPLLFGCLFEYREADSREKIAFQLFTEEELRKGCRSGSPSSSPKQN